MKREQFYIDSLNPEYNILKIAGSRLGSKQSLTVKNKISSTLTGRIIDSSTKIKQRNAKLGFKHSPETLVKLKEHLNNLNVNILPKKNSIQVKVLDLETNITIKYDSIRKAAKAIKSYANTLLKYEKLCLNKGYNKPFFI